MDQHNEDLAARLTELARLLHGKEGVESTLSVIVRAAVGTVPGAEHAGISLVERRREVHTRAATGDLVHAVDRAQYETGEGPCLDAVYAERTVLLADIAGEDRWPRFVERAGHLGVGSMLSFQLFVRQDTLGALNLYSADKHAFDEDSVHVGSLFAAHAAVAMSGARQQEHLQQAISARDVIGQAKGILMERYKLTADQAFTVLARASQERNVKLIEVARSLTDTGELIGHRRSGRPA